ncbi:MAG: hypothetical protein ACOX6A_09030 [Atribacter sp.]|uniref:hypothetical protein n=1 Tax=Atribacter sp. TaxID=2847780 RepID=UPI003D96E8DA
MEEVRDATQLNQAKMVVDIIDLSLSDESKIQFINSLNPDYLCIHLSTDVVKKGGSLLEFSRQSSFCFFSSFTPNGGGRYSFS